jgi:signal transduction histidine kinase
MDTIETTIYTAVLITGFIIGTIIVYFAVTILRNHRRHFKMLRQNFLEEMQVLEKERDRIGRDLHDELGPLLTVTKIHINAVQGLPPEEQQHLEKAVSNIDDLTNRFSRIARNLTPRLLARRGLQTALSDFFAQHEEVSPIKMNFIYRIQKVHDPNLSLQLFRIIQELLHNAVKHSEASELTVHLTERKKKIYLSYKDNGKGMAPGSETQAGIGLSSLRNRAEMSGGKMKTIESVLQGTEYFFEIPIAKNYETNDTSGNS